MSIGVLHILDSTSNKPRPLTLASGVLSVNDSNARSSLANLDSKITICDTSGLATSVAQSTANSSLSNIESSLSSTLIVSDTTAQSTLSSIESALAGTLSTTTTISVSKSSTTVSSAQMVVSGDFSSSSHDCSSQRNVTVVGTTTDTSSNIEIHVSADNSTFYKYGQNSLYPASDGSVGSNYEAPFNYIKVKYTGSGTATILIMGSD